MKKIRSTGMINFRDTHNGRGFAARGINRQLAFSHKRRAQGLGWDEVGSRMHISAPRDLETLVCARGAKLSLKSLSKRLESPRRGSRGLIYDLPATARPARIQGVAGFGGRSGANVISQAEKFAKLDFNYG